jgi:hypothetical protein
VIYSVAIYDLSGNRLTILTDVSNPSYSRSKNTADQINFSIPRTSSGIPFIKTSRRFEILRTIGGVSDVEASGFISNHGYSENFYDVEGYSEEIILSQLLTPPQYGYVLSSENQTLNVLVEQFTRSFIVERVKQNWDDYIIDSSNITTSAANFITLINDGDLENPDYRSSGYATFEFQKLSSETWDRIRWVSDYYVDEDGEITTKISYRTSADGITWGSFTTPQPGALTDIVGLVIAGDEDDYLEVRVDFDTPTKEAAPAFFSIEVIKRGDSPIVSVDVDTGSSSIPVLGLPGDNTSFLDVLIAACEPSGYEFKVEDGVLFIKESFGEDRSNSYAVVSG